uniref:Uncharacterized protein n=1 Tax=Daphnia galeata TaxID=27404 RepID=A0A8J2RYC1_9CRUS|nr:unnamed protein product [Daphnia galeata]
MAIVNWVMDKFVKVGRETHVANAYTENIYVRVTADIRYLEKDSDVSIANFKINSGKNIWDKCDKDGFTRIAPNYFFKFEPDTSNSAYVYITVVTESGEVICEAVSKTVNASIIVDRSGNILDTKMGTIWTDTNGNKHPYCI